MTQTTSPQVAAAYAAFPTELQEMAQDLRALVLSVAEELPEVGPIEETLKWGQPSFTTPKTKAGSTLRIGTTKAGEVGLFAHCATTIISDYVSTFPGADRIDGNRGVLFCKQDEIVPERLRLLIRHALTYHL